jgi:cytochrome c556
MAQAKGLGGIVLSLAIVGTGIAADDPIGERRELMRTMARAERAATSAILGKYLPVKVIASLKTIQDIMIGFPDLFPVGSEAGGESNASPAIWTETAAFEALASKIVEDARAAEVAAAQGQDAFAVAWQAISDDCGSCHAQFAPTLMIR